ncbi:DegV family protein [Anaerococcus sp. mt242]|uniref:DegV family protein n=1 Tax=Anaerococcus sp. mt242 TaxID=2661917 RepID=UPI001933B433|nr:DegV family protein [Anaerococcus sp. mt242]MBM0047009.1 DegV family protein [Anaerococcus sp. mt242]
MEKIAILADTASDIDTKLAEEMGIYLLPLYVNLDSKYYKDRIEISTDEFYDWMRDSDSIPKTSTASPGELHDILEQIKNDGYEKVIAVSIGAHFSSTYNLFNMINIDGLKTYVFDSGNLTLSEGIFAIYAKELVDDGYGFDEIIEKLNAKKDDSKVFFALDTFKYLVAGGRVPRSFGKIGDALSVKPIITINPEESIFKLFKITRGEKKVLNEFRKIAEKELENVKDYYFYIGHGGYEGGMEKLEELFSDIIAGAKRNFEIQISPTLGANTGPGLFGFGFFKLD